MNSLLIIVLALFLSAFFSAVEFSFFASNKLRIELDRKQGLLGSEIISLFSRNQGQFIATMLIGNNIAIVIFSMIAANLIEKGLGTFISSEVLVFVIQTIVTTLIILILADFLPKSLVRFNPNSFLKLFALPTFLFYLVFYPVSKFTLWLANIIMRLFFGFRNEGGKQEDRVFTRIDLDHFVNDFIETDKEKEEENNNIKIFQNALDFSRVKARECMVPRTEVVAMNISSTYEEIKQKFIETRLSKIPLFNETIDNITGYVELKDLLKEPVEPVTKMRKLPVVPESMTANKILKLFNEEKNSIALVVDEFGGTSGIVTIEDILEEIVGEIEDEHDTIDLVEKKISEKEFILSGRLEIDYLNEKYDFKLPENDDYKTLAGLILSQSGYIPHSQESIRVGSNVFTVLKSTTTRVELLRLIID
ncbi:MAG TPA: hemolysin family protein [Bacteroidales bacterium]|nr:hemolysin family protein [Bacteroidales bacterium]HPT12160.1 hemolysin family protein [Bacteroidales bacterium]